MFSTQKNEYNSSIINQCTEIFFLAVKLNFTIKRLIKTTKTKKTNNTNYSEKKKQLRRGNKK